MNDDQLRLRSNKLELLIAPKVGGSIARLDYLRNGERLPVLRGTDSSAFEVEDAGCFPLVPYCNRIRNGRFSFRGRDISISRNKPADASPLHGHGWQTQWEVVSHSEREAVIAFRHDAGEWPWAYEATQAFRLEDQGLELKISCRNLSDQPMPCGLGQHPYYPCTAETRIDTKVGHVWTIDEKVLPVERIPAEGRYSMEDRLVCSQDLDNGYDGWSGEARVWTPGISFETRLSSPDAHFYQFYSPTGGDFFVAEPVSHANAALNEPESSWPSLGMRVLEPGEEMSLTARFDVIERS